MSRQQAPPPGVLDTSFWAATALADAHGYLLKLFEVHCPQAVVAEIENEKPPQLRPDAALFQQLRAHGTIQVTNPRELTVRLFGAGERAVLSLAQERAWVGLVNEWRAYAHGHDGMRLQMMNVPQLILAACALGHFPTGKAHQMLSKIANVTSPQLMQEATRVLEALPSGEREGVKQDGR
ncbi:MAG: hypothetical protein HY216_10040 [Candidatus Rokubacteria bacterium]|nr:hypothetical protein [Candidatus Rokubacteria bacterium]